MAKAFMTSILNFFLILSAVMATGELESVQLAVAQQDIALGVVTALESFGAFRSSPRLAGAVVPAIGLIGLVALVVTSGSVRCVLRRFKENGRFWRSDYKGTKKV